MPSSLGLACLTLQLTSLGELYGRKAQKREERLVGVLHNLLIAPGYLRQLPGLSDIRLHPGSPLSFYQLRSSWTAGNMKHLKYSTPL